MDTVDDFISMAHSIVWCTLATVDTRDRPRSRIVHPIWERTPDGLVGWVGTNPTPVKRAHLEHSAYASCSYWSPQHDFAIAECSAGWVDDEEGRLAVWEKFKTAPAPYGYDPAPIWPDGPEHESWAVLRLEPWRLRLRSGEAMMRREAPRVWAPERAALSSTGRSS